MKFLWRAFRWLLMGGILLFCIYQIWIFLHIWYWVEHNPDSSAFMEERLDTLQQANPDIELKHRWLPYSRISINLKRALIAAEDAKFTDHDGFDWEGIQKAYEKNVAKGKIVAGGSTISQQLAKNLFLTSKRTPWRKAQEALITVMLEHMLSKRRIFEIYLNVIEWGNGIYGAEAAAQRYYHASAQQLNPEQAARLAAMVPNPRYFEKNSKSKQINRKTSIILLRMRGAEIP